MRAQYWLIGCVSLALLISTVLSAPKAVAQEPEVAHFHHIHLNVTDPKKTMSFYQHVFGALPMKFMGKQDCLFTGQSFILWNVVPTPPPAKIESGIWHIGWGGIDVPNEYAWWKKDPQVKIHTDLYQLGNGWVTYLDGPDGERIEINTQGHHRYSHIHMIAEDPNKTAQWYADNLNVPLRRRETPRPPDLTKVRSWSNSFNVDHVNIIVYNKPDFTPAPPWWDQEPLKEFKTSKGRAIDHIAFSFRKLEPAFERMKAKGVEIVEPIKLRDEGFKSFFVQAPDGVLVEIVESKPIPDGIWE